MEWEYSCKNPRWCCHAKLDYLDEEPEHKADPTAEIGAMVRNYLIVQIYSQPQVPVLDGVFENCDLHFWTSPKGVERSKSWKPIRDSCWPGNISVKQLDLEWVVDEEVQSSDGEEGNDLIFGQSPSQFTWKHDQYWKLTNIWVRQILILLICLFYCEKHTLKPGKLLYLFCSFAFI